MILATAALAGCGGIASGVGDALDAIGDGLICGLRNCTESSTLNVDEISPRFTASQTAGDGRVVVEGFLGKSANVLTTVLMAPGERLSVNVDGGPDVPMSNPDGKRQDYTVAVATGSARPVVQLVFTRGGVRHVSQVTLPAPFTVLQPVGGALLTRNGAAVPVRLSLAGVGDAAAVASGSCNRADGSSFALQGTGLMARADGSMAGAYRLEPAAVDEALNATSRSANNSDPKTATVSRCELTVTWVQSARGSIAPTLNAHGSLTGERRATHPLSYDARL